MAPHGPSTVCKRLFGKEILVGAVGIEPTTPMPYQN